MNLGYWIIVGLWIFTVILILRRGRVIEQNYRDLIEARLEKEILEKHKYQITQQRLVNEAIEEKKQEVQQIENDISARKVVLKALDNDLETQRKYIDRYVYDIKEEKLKIVDEQVQQKLVIMKQEAQANYQEQMQIMAKAAETAQQELDKIVSNLEEYRIKQDAINQEILRRRELEEKQDFSRICLSNEAKSDINYLLSIVSNLKNPTILYKLIWSEYIQKQFNQMLKNVLGATDPRNVIYSITNIKTKEIYIGKTKAEVSKRWTEHIKTSLNIGTIKSAKIHEALYNHWDDFVFSIIEKVPLEQSLSEREKFYIDFYKSNIYGYNLKSGG